MFQPNYVITLVVIGTIISNCCICCCSNCMSDIYGGITFVVICVIRLILYIIIIIIIITGEFYGFDLIFEAVPTLIVVICICQYYRMYKLLKPHAIQTGAINQNLLDQQNNSSYPPQMMQPVQYAMQPPQQFVQPPQQVIQPPTQVIQPPIQPVPPSQPIVNNVSPNEGYYPGPPMNTVYDNNYKNQNDGGYNV